MAMSVLGNNASADTLRQHYCAIAPSFYSRMEGTDLCKHFSRAARLLVPADAPNMPLCPSNHQQASTDHSLSAGFSSLFGTGRWSQMNYLKN